MSAKESGNGLLRWLLGGLAAGGVVLGLLIGAYAVGYHRGHETVKPAAVRPVTTAPTPTTPSGSALEAQGKRLFTADACASCHSLDGSPGVGPTLKGLVGSSVRLTGGEAVTADDAYIARSITDPDAQIVQGFQRGVMSAAAKSFGLGAKPQDVKALVEFIKAQK